MDVIFLIMFWLVRDKLKKFSAFVTWLLFTLIPQLFMSVNRPGRMDASVLRQSVGGERWCVQKTVCLHIL